MGDTMRVKSIVSERFQDYKLPSMFIATCFCDYKCCTELGLDIGMCQNAPLAQMEDKDIDDQIIYEQFVKNPITKAVVVGGLEPMIQINEVIKLINLFRNQGENCPFVIYTGYYPNEIPQPLERLKQYKNIIVKFGRFVPNEKSRYDEVLGVTLASDNQYAKVIS